MSIVSWNCRGLGSDPKVTTLNELIKSEKPFILLLQETKMAATKVLKIGK
jgi:exonuclease III